MRMALLTLLALAVPAFAGQTVWKWVDEKGVTHYSDTPRPGATQMELSTVNRSGSSSSTPPSTSTPSAPPAPAASAAQPRYTSFEVVEPTQGQTVVNTGGLIEVNLEVAPGGLQPGHTIVVYVDGKQVEGFPPNGLSYNLTEVPRGTHTIQAVIVDGDGTRVRTTQAVAFYVRQESAAQPPVGPTLRPPPKQRKTAGNKLPTTQPSYAALNGAAAMTVDPRTNLPPKTKPAPVGPRAGN